MPVHVEYTTIPNVLRFVHHNYSIYSTMVLHHHKSGQDNCQHTHIFPTISPSLSLFPSIYRFRRKALKSPNSLDPHQWPIYHQHLRNLAFNAARHIHTRQTCRSISAPPLLVILSLFLGRSHTRYKANKAVVRMSLIYLTIQ